MIWDEMSYNKYTSRETEPEVWMLDEDKENLLTTLYVYEAEEIDCWSDK